MLCLKAATIWITFGSKLVEKTLSSIVDRNMKPFPQLKHNILKRRIALVLVLPDRRSISTVRFTTRLADRRLSVCEPYRPSTTHEQEVPKCFPRVQLAVAPRGCWRPVHNPYLLCDGGLVEFEQLLKFSEVLNNFLKKG